MKVQVTSFEQSKRLLDAGIPSDLSSMSWVRVPEWMGDSGYKIMGKWQLLVNPVDPEEGQEVIPAFTVGDLIRMLPPDEDIYNLVIERSPNRGWNVRYREIGTDYLIRGKYDISLVGALAQMVEEIKREEDADPLHIRRIYPYEF